MERMSSSLQSWVEEHKLSTIGAVWATAVGASVGAGDGHAAHPRQDARAGAHYYGSSGGSKKRQQQEDLDYGFYSQLPSATDADGNENERWSW